MAKAFTVRWLDSKRAAEPVGFQAALKTVRARLKAKRFRLKRERDDFSWGPWLDRNEAVSRVSNIATSMPIGELVRVQVGNEDGRVLALLAVEPAPTVKLPSGSDRWHPTLRDVYVFVFGTKWKNGQPYFAGAENCRPNRRDPSQWSMHCLGGDTLVQTWDGLFPISKLAGSTPRLLTKAPLTQNVRGRWIDAPVRSFGDQPVSAIRLTIGRGTEKVVRATPQHRWFVERGPEWARRCIEVRTSELLPGDKLMTSFPRHIGRISPSPFGVVAGLVFGDGWVAEKGSAFIRLWGRDRELLPYFPRVCDTSTRITQGGVEGVEVRGLPRTFKALPPLSESPAFLAGWLAGYIAADGHVDSDTVSLASTTLEHLEFASTVAARLGIATRRPHSYVTTGGYRPGAVQWQMRFVKSTVPDWLLVHPKQKEAWPLRTPDGPPARWSVVSVEPDGVEEVFCATVPETRSFVIEDNILTGNSYWPPVLAEDIGVPNLPLGDEIVKAVEKQWPYPEIVAVWRAPLHFSHAHLQIGHNRDGTPECAR